MVVKPKFFVDHRYNHISFNDSLTWKQIREMEDWCKQNEAYVVYYTGIAYNTDQDLTAFLLRWE